MAVVHNDGMGRQVAVTGIGTGVDCHMLHLLPPSQPLHPVTEEEQQSLKASLWSVT